MATAATTKPDARKREFLEWLTKRHGVAHTAEARSMGFTPREIAVFVEAGAIHRVRRSWLVTIDCDPRRIQAASVSGRLTCVSAAALHGMWTPDHDETHVAVAGTASRLNTDGIRLHWTTGPAPVGRVAIEDPMINVLFHVARCLPERDALAVWESAIRGKKADPKVLRRVAWRNADAAALARMASQLSDSGVETRFVDGMRAAGVAVRQQVWVDGHPLDGLIGDRLAVQLDGFAHHGAASERRRDIEADARLVVRGFFVLRFDWYQVFFQWEVVLEAVLTAMAQGLHRDPAHRNR